MRSVKLIALSGSSSTYEIIVNKQRPTGVVAESATQATRTLAEAPIIYKHTNRKRGEAVNN